MEFGFFIIIFIFMYILLAIFLELRMRIEQDPILEQTLQGLSDDEVMVRLGKAGEKPEGRFLADTYFSFRGIPRTSTS
jgi:cell division protein YceG involved in septum cleavage